MEIAATGTPSFLGRSRKALLKRFAIALALTLFALASAAADGSDCNGPWKSAAEIRLLPPARAVTEFERALPCAEKGVAGAQTVLGRMYDSGRGVRQNFAEAMRWYQLAAAQNDPSAQNNLGVMHQFGHGMPVDLATAVAWYRLSAEQGHPVAQANLASAYRDGRGVSRDLGEAFRLYKLAAEQNYPVAQRALASMYERGEGVVHDAVEAVRWYRKAADRGDAQAQQALNRLSAIV